jgi:hypothetical protein
VARGALHKNAAACQVNATGEGVKENQHRAQQYRLVSGAFAVQLLEI